MNVFISWSGHRSRSVAEALRSWLPRVVQAARPWMSDEDISAGSRWLSAIQSELSSSAFGIICITPENQANPWLLFEAGALSTALTQSRVCPLLLDISPSQLSGPLSQFQANEANRGGIERVVISLNKALGKLSIPIEDMHEIVDVWWPKLEKSIADSTALQHDKGKKRPLEDILDEVALNTREQLRREKLRIELTQERDRRIDEFIGLMDGFLVPLAQAQDRFKALGAMHEPKVEDLVRIMASSQPDMRMLHQLFGTIENVKNAQREFDKRVLAGSDANSIGAEQSNQDSKQIPPNNSET